MKSFIVLIASLLSGLCSAAHSSSSIRNEPAVFLRLSFSGNKPPDSLYFIYWENFLTENTMINVPCKIVAAPASDLVFRFSLPPGINGVYGIVKTVGQVSGGSNVLPLLLFEPGDSITVSISQSNREVSGRGSQKINAGSAIEKAIKQWEEKKKQEAAQAFAPHNLDSAYHITFPDALQRAFRYANEKQVVSTNVLFKYKDSISPFIFQWMQSEIMGQAEKAKLKAWNFYAKNMGVKPAAYKDSLRSKLRTLLLNEPVQLAGLNAEAVAASKDCMDYYRLMASYAENLFAQPGIEFINKETKGLLHDKLLAEYAMTATSEERSAFCSSPKMINDRFSRQLVDTCCIRNMEGADAFNFQLEGSDGSKISLAGIQGDKIVAVLWFNGCSGAQQLSMHMQQVRQHFKNDSHITFVSINLDKTKTVWQQAIKESYAALGDIQLFTGGQGVNHSIVHHYMLQSFPAIIITDNHQKVVAVNPIPASARRAKELIRLLEDSK